MRATALGIGLAMLGGIGIAQAQVPPKPGAGGAQAGRPVLLLPLPNGGYAIAQQSGQAGEPGQGEAGDQSEHGQGMPGMPGGMHMMGRQGMMGMMGRQGMEHRGWMRNREMGEGGGAIFAFRSPRGNIFIRCAASEPMRACVAAASVLIDRIGSMGQPHGPPGATPHGPNSGQNPTGNLPGSSSGSSGSSSSSGSSGTSGSGKSP